MGVKVYFQSPTKEAIDKIVNESKKKVELKILTMLKFIGESAVSYARDNHGYTDRTGNLTSSIGYVICKRGEIIEESSFEQVSSNINSGESKEKGSEIGRTYAETIAKDFPNDYVLVVVAGMNYAAYVERLGYDVLAGSKIEAEKIAKQLVEKLKK